MTDASALMAGKKGLIMGVANDRSLAWGVARAVAGAGARLALTYQGDSLGKRVKPLAQSVRRRHGAALRRHRRRLAGRRLRRARAGLAEPRFVVHAVAFSDKEQLKGRYLDTTLANFRSTMEVSCYSFNRRLPAGQPADGPRRQPAHAHLLRRRESDAALQRHGRGQGRARGQRALHRRRPRRRRNSLQRDLGGADQDAGRLRHRRLSLYPQMERIQRAAQAERVDRRGRQGRPVPAERPRQRRHRRGPPCRLRLPRGRDEGGSTRPTSRS